MKKKIPALLTAATMLFPLSACATAKEETNPPEDNPQKNEQVSNDAYAGLQAQIDKLKEENEKLKESNQELSDKLNKETEKLKESDQKLSAEQAEIMTRILKIIDTQDSMQESLNGKADNTNLESVITSLQGIVDEFEETQEVNTERFNALETSLSDLLTELDLIKTQVEALQDNTQILDELQTIRETVSVIQDEVLEIKLKNCIKDTFKDFMTVDNADCFYYTSPDGEYVKTTQDGDPLRLFTNGIAFHADREQNIETGAEAVDDYIVRLLNQNNASYSGTNDYIVAQLDEDNSAMFEFGTDGKVDQIQIYNSAQNENQRFYISRSNKNVFEMVKKLATEKVESYKLYNEINSAIDNVDSFDFMHVVARSEQMEGDFYLSDTKSAASINVGGQSQQAYNENGVVYGDQTLMSGLEKEYLAQTLKASVWDGIRHIEKQGESFVMTGNFNSAIRFTSTSTSLQFEINTEVAQAMTQTISQITEDEFNSKFGKIKTAVDNAAQQDLTQTNERTK